VPEVRQQDQASFIRLRPGLKT